MFKTMTDYLVFLKFGLVGTVGAVINISIYYFLNKVILLDINFCALIAFAVALTSKYVLNHTWTFASDTLGASMSF